MKLSKIGFGILLLLLGTCTRLDELRFGETQTVTIVESDFHVAFPSVERLTSGDLLVVFRSGSAHVSPDGKILLMRSTDGGHTWSTPDTIISTLWDARDPSITQLNNGLILINFFQSRYDAADSLIGAMGCFTVRSFDEGRTFTAPRMVQIPGMDWSATSDAVLELTDGTLLLPVYGGNEDESASAMVVRSTDGGESWEETNLIARDAANLIHYQEPALVSLADGRIVCMMRTAGAGTGTFLYQSVSHDNGKTWALPWRSGIRGQAPDLFLIREGPLLCAYRDFWPRGVGLMRSYDEGMTWEKEIQLYGADGDCAYPNIIDVADRLFAVHYAVRGGGEESGINGTFFKVDRLDRPGGFIVSADRDRGVALRWNQIEGATYYTVYRDTLPDFEPKPGYPFEGNAIATPTASRYVDTGTVPGRVYYYRITAVAGTGRHSGGSGCESPPTEAMRIVSE